MPARVHSRAHTETAESGSTVDKAGTGSPVRGNWVDATAMIKWAATPADAVFSYGASG